MLMSRHTEVKRYYSEFLVCQEIRACTNSGYQPLFSNFSTGPGEKARVTAIIMAPFCLAAFEIKIETKCGVKPGLE